MRMDTGSLVITAPWPLLKFVVKKPVLWVSETGWHSQHDVSLEHSYSAS